MSCTPEKIAIVAAKTGKPGTESPVNNGLPSKSKGNGAVSRRCVKHEPKKFAEVVVRPTFCPNVVSNLDRTELGGRPVEERVKRNTWTKVLLK